MKRRWAVLVDDFFAWLFLGIVVGMWNLPLPWRAGAKPDQSHLIVLMLFAVFFQLSALRGELRDDKKESDNG